MKIDLNPPGVRSPGFHYTPAAATDIRQTFAKARGEAPVKIRVVLSGDTDLGDFCTRKARQGYRVMADARGLYMVRVA